MKMDGTILLTMTVIILMVDRILVYPVQIFRQTMVVLSWGTLSMIKKAVKLLTVILASFSLNGCLVQRFFLDDYPGDYKNENFYIRLAQDEYYGYIKYNNQTTIIEIGQVVAANTIIFYKHDDSCTIETAKKLFCATVRVTKDYLKFKVYNDYSDGKYNGKKFNLKKVDDKDKEDLSYINSCWNQNKKH